MDLNEVQVWGFGSTQPENKQTTAETHKSRKAEQVITALLRLHLVSGLKSAFKNFVMLLKSEFLVQ